MSKKANANSSEALTAATGYTALLASNLLAEALSEDCSGMDFTFDRIKMLGAGATGFEVAGEDGETEMVKEIKGVIVYSHPAYGFYRTKYAGGSNPPDCGSFDGITGVGDPGGDCRSCPYNQFGSGDGKGKACKNRRMLYIMQEGELFPVMLSLPVGSVAGYTNYIKRLLSKQHLRVSQVVTSISLRKANSSDGIAFSQAVFKTERVLQPEEQKAIATVTEQVKAYAANLSAVTAANAEDVPFVDASTGEVIEPLN